MEKQPNYRMIKNYVLARGLVILAESIRKTDYHGNYFNKREFAMGWCLQWNWRTEDKWEHQGKTEIQTTGSSYHLVRNLETKLKLVDP